MSCAASCAASSFKKFPGNIAAGRPGWARAVAGGVVSRTRNLSPSTPPECLFCGVGNRPRTGVGDNAPARSTHQGALRRVIAVAAVVVAATVGVVALVGRDVSRRIVTFDGGGGCYRVLPGAVDIGQALHEDFVEPVVFVYDPPAQPILTSPASGEERQALEVLADGSVFARFTVPRRTPAFYRQPTQAVWLVVVYDAANMPSFSPGGSFRLGKPCRVPPHRPVLVGRPPSTAGSFGLALAKT